jgi:hypothetical protein
MRLASTGGARAGGNRQGRSAATRGGGCCMRREGLTAKQGMTPDQLTDMPRPGSLPQEPSSAGIWQVAIAGGQGEHR